MRESWTTASGFLAVANLNLDLGKFCCFSKPWPAKARDGRMCLVALGKSSPSGTLAQLPELRLIAILPRTI